MEFSIIRSKTIRSSNVKSYRYDTEDLTLEIEFLDGSKYKYFDISFAEFENVARGRASCITEGENEFGRWWIGKTPSVGASLYRYLIQKNKRYQKMSKIKKLDKDKLPVYEIVVDEMDETGISLISLVDAPAIEMKGMYFSENKQMTFKEVKDEQMIIGPALIPDMKIYREDANFGQYYVTFTKDTIAKMVEKFNRTGSNRKINLEHTNEMVNAFIVEDWIVEDNVYDKSRKYGFEVPIGTYMIKVKVDDEKFWHEQVKDNGKFGFSIEGILGQKLISLKSEYAETYTDYPKAASDNAKRALDWIDKYGRDVVTAGTLVGLARANQLANREPISLDTVKRMAAFNRHRENAKINEDVKGTPWLDKGYVSWLLWGGTAGVDWAIRKVEKIRQEKALKAFSENNLEQMLEELDENEFEIFVKEVLGLLDDENLNEVVFNKITNLFGLK